MITLNKVAYSYSGHLIFNNVSCSFPRGSLTAIVGPSGAGKSTLLKLILGILKPQAGEIIKQSQTIKFGYVPQIDEIDWYFPINVAEVISLGFKKQKKFFGLNKNEKMLIKEVANALNLAHLLERPLRALSGGEQQRVFLARALISAPDVLVLDEPTTGADIATVAEVVKILLNINKETGTTIILSTHDLLQIASRWPRLIFFNRGLVAQATWETITSEILEKTFGTSEIYIPTQKGSKKFYGLFS